MLMLIKWQSRSTDGSSDNRRHIQYSLLKIQNLALTNPPPPQLLLFWWLHLA